MLPIGCPHILLIRSISLQPLLLVGVISLPYLSSRSHRLQSWSGNKAPIIIACSVLCPQVLAVCFVLKTFDTEGSPCNLILTLHLERDFETEGISELLCPHSVLEHEFKRLDKWPTTLILWFLGGRSSMAEQKLPMLTTGVRFSSPAPMASIRVISFKSGNRCVRSRRLFRINHRYRHQFDENCSFTTLW